jgi:hypothetical protein
VFRIEESAMPDPATLPMVQFLAWVASRPRTYGEVRQAWRSTCPRLTMWEDAVEDGLVRFDHEGERLTDRSRVSLTGRAQAMLADGISGGGHASG